MQASDEYPYRFEAHIERYRVGQERKIEYSVVFLAPELELELPFKHYPRLRVVAWIDEVKISGAWIPSGDGRHYMILSPRILKPADLCVGDRIQVRFRIDDQDAVDVPPELLEALTTHSQARQSWEKLTPGKQRGLTHLIHSARTTSYPQPARR